MRRISGTEKGFVLVLMFDTASAICDLKASSSAIDDSVGEPFCKFCKPGYDVSSDDDLHDTHLDQE